MNTINLTCKNCNAPLNVNIDKLACYCPYCGGHLMLDIQDLDAVLLEKERTKQKMAEEQSERMRAVQENARAEQEYYKSRRDKNVSRQEKERTKQMKLELEMQRQRKSEEEDAWLRDHPVLTTIIFGGMILLIGVMFVGMMVLSIWGK